MCSCEAELLKAVSQTYELYSSIVENRWDRFSELRFVASQLSKKNRTEQN